MKKQLKIKVILILSMSVLLSLTLLLVENVFTNSESVIMRNSYGGGKKVAEYELEVEGEEQTFQIEVGEQEYSVKEIRDIFREVTDKLDSVVLGENKSFDHVEKNLNLVTGLEGYPVKIQWQLDSYTAMNLYGELQEENLVQEGTLVELRATISYMEEETIYVRHANVYPVTRKGADKLLYEIEQKVRQLEKDTRQKESFTLPEEIEGKKLTWSQKKENRWYYVLLLGIVLCVYLVYRESEKVTKEKRQRADQLLRDYPEVISKLTMLLSTGATVRSAWEKIVENYERQKDSMGTHVVYEEMAMSLREMQGGISEAETYERFGKRCGVTAYVKFGTLLSQNLRKGSKGMLDVLRMEAIQSFENRKSTAKRLGEEAGTKLLMPMLGMLAVVFIIVMVPAFLSMQL